MSAQRAMPPSQTLAPWAEIVPGVGPTTVDALLVMPDDGWRYEVVEGVLVRVAGSGKQATTIGGNIYFALRSFVQPRRLGVPTPADGVYKSLCVKQFVRVNGLSRGRHPRKQRS